MEQLKFFKGKEEDLLKKTDIEAGAIYHCTDTKNTYLGTSQNGLIPYSSAIGKATNKIGGEIFNDYANNIAGEGAHAEGGSTKAEGRFSHVEGEGTITRGIASHAEGKDCEAVGDYSHAEGIGTFARANAQNVIGKYNEKDIDQNYVHIVGNGNSDVDRKNIHTLDWNGNAWFAGNLKIGGAGPDDPSAKEVSGNDSIIPMDDMFSGYDHFYTNIAQGRVNPEEPLEISTYDGSGQLTHPCVRYFPEGFGNHQFWMTATPYPYSALDLENPCVWYSDDGYEWSADGIPNPLDLPLMVNGEQASMNSDPHLLLRPDGIMEIWWRTNFWENSGEGLYTVIYRRTSTDGIHWTEKEELHRAGTNSNDGMVCPVALYENNIYKIWGVSDQESLRYFESADGKQWRHVRDIDVNNSDYPEYKVWHFDVNHTAKGYEFVGSYNIPGDYTAHKYIYYAVSEDNITYSKRALILTTGENGSFDERLLYRPTIIRLENQVRIYYGANNADNVWSIGMIEAPSAYLFNALLTQGKRIQAIEYNIDELKNKTPIADGLTIVESFRNSPWLPGYWKPEENGVFAMYGDLHHSQLVPLANLMDGGQLAKITVTSNVSYWPLVRVNYFNGNLEWIGYDAGASTDPANGTQEPTPINWPAGAVYVAISANTAVKDDINVMSIPIVDEGLTIVQSFEESPWIKGYWKPEDGGTMTIYNNFYHSQLVPLANLMNDGELANISMICPNKWATLRINYFDGQLKWIGFDESQQPNGIQSEPLLVRWPAGAVYVAISANATDKSEITISGVPESGDCEISEEQVQSDWTQNDPTQPDYVKNRTHWEENNQTVIEWDGVTEGRDCVSPEDGLTLCKISDTLIEPEELVGRTIHLSDGRTYEITSDHIMIEDGVYGIVDFVTKSIYLYAIQALEASGVVFPSTGMYALYSDGMPYFSKVEYGNQVIHQLDEKFIPDTIVRTEQLKDEIFVVTANVNYESVSTETEIHDIYAILTQYYQCTLDRTLDEIDAAYNEGKIIIARHGESYDIDDDTIHDYTYMPLIEGQSRESYYFCAKISDKIECCLEISSYNGGSFYFKQTDYFSPVPEPTANNNGAFLRVVDGTYALVNLTDVSVEGA